MLISRKVLFVLVALVLALSVGTVVFMPWTQMNSTSSFEFGGIERTYLLHVPPSYDGRTSVPLVIMLHGWTQTSFDAQTFSGFSAKSDKEGFIVVYPQGVQGTQGSQWNVGFLLKSNIDDVGFINELINRLEQRYAIDPKRIYVAGFSMGAMMTYLLGARLSDRIAAIAPVSGTIGAVTNNTLEQIPEPARPVPVIVFHGTADTMVPYNGDGVVSVAESVAFWVEHDGCSVNALNETSSDGRVIKSVYTAGKNGTEVVLYTLVGVGHVWPTSPIYYIMATDVIWGFFVSHPKQ